MSMSFRELLAKFRNDVRTTEGLSAQERQALNSLLDMSQAIFETFENGHVRDENAGREPPLNNDECADLMGFVMSLATERSGDQNAPLEVEMSGRRKIALSIMAIAPVLERSNQTYIAMTSADAARGKAMQSFNRADPPLNFITWSEADPARLRNHGIIAEADLSTAPAGQREMIAGKLEQLKRTQGVNLMMLVSQKGARPARQESAPQASNSGCALIVGVLLLSAAAVNWIVA